MLDYLPGGDLLEYMYINGCIGEGEARRYNYRLEISLSSVQSFAIDSNPFETLLFLPEKHLPELRSPPCQKIFAKSRWRSTTPMPEALSIET